MADEPQNDDAADETPLVKRLRKQLDEQSAQLRQYKTRDALQEAGFDPASPQAKALMKLHDGDMTSEAIQATAQEYGFTVPEPPAAEADPAAEERSATIARVDELRSNATPVGTQRTSYEDYQQMQQQNPAAAAAALQAGTVDLPPHIAAVVQANRADRESRQLA